MRSKVIGNKDSKNDVYHNFPIGSVVVMKSVGLTDTSAVYSLADDQTTAQILYTKDVEPMALSEFEAAKKLSDVVDGINRAISEAEKIADEYGLSFSLEPAYGMGGYYYGTGNPELEGRYAPDQGWNPSSTSC
jgi:hypothetical protein